MVHDGTRDLVATWKKPVMITLMVGFLISYESSRRCPVESHVSVTVCKVVVVTSHWT